MISQDLAIIIQAVIEEASNANCEFITVEHLLYGVIHDEYGSQILEACGCNLKKLETDLKKHLKEENHLFITFTQVTWYNEEHI